MLAAIALMLATVVVVKLKRERYVWVPGIPAIWLIVCTLTAGWQKLVGPISFTAAAQKYAAGRATERAQLLAPAKTAEEMQRIVTNNHVDMALTGLFMLLIVTMLAFFSLSRALVRHQWRPCWHGRRVSAYATIRRCRRYANAATKS
jgi:carbon starvation protein CstA